MPDHYDSRGNYLYTTLIPGTVGYPINTEDMSDEEKEALEPIKIDRYPDEED